MKKLISALLSLGCLLACAAAIMPAQNASVTNGNSIVLSAYAAEEAADDDINTSPGINAASYRYQFADASYYTTTIAPVSIKEKVSDKLTIDYTQWPLDESNKVKTDVPVYSYYKITVTHKEGKKTVTDLTEYRVGLAKGVNTELDAAPSQTVEVPEYVKNYMSSKFADQTVDAGKVTVIGAGAYKGSYLKTIDLTGISVIGKGAFESCSYITEITLPQTVNYIGDSAFASSGLKTLTVNCDMPMIPNSFCESTKLTKITFAHPEYIRQIGKAAFKNTPVTATIFEEWAGKDVSGYEELHVLDSAYEGCTSIKSVKMPDNLTFLEKSVFKGCTSLSQLVIGKNTLSLDAECCADCTALDTIVFNDKLFSLGGGVFSGCTSLKKVENMPNTINDWVEVTKNTGYGFGNNMFANCTSLISVKLPDSITKIPEGVFKGCTALNYVYNSQNITSIGLEAFQGCTHLLEATYPKVEAIENNAFDGCSDLKAIKFEKCSSIGDYAFRNCKSATAFAVADCSTVGKNALEGCIGLKSIKLLSEKYGEYVFKNCSNAQTIEIKCDNMAQTPKGMCSGCAALTTLNGDLSKVPIISAYSFENCTSLKDVNFSSVRIIEESAFVNCSSLKSICKGAITAEDYGAMCFQNCTALTAEVSGNISTIGASAFQNSAITKVNVNGMVGGTVVIGKSAFADCPNLTAASILSPQGAVFSVGDAVFSNCPKLASADYAGPVVTASMFKDCTDLKDVWISSTTISANAFENCTSLPKVMSKADPSKSIIAKEVGDAAFKNCAALAIAPADKNTTYTGSQQYYGTAITKADANMLTAGMFGNCKKLASVTLASDIKSIPAGTFQNCEALTALNLNDMLSIGNNAFAGAGLKEVKIENAQTVGTGAFLGCGNLAKVDVSAESIGKQAFANNTHLTEAAVCTKTLGDQAFYGDTALTKVNLQNSDSRVLNSIGAGAFNNCNALTDLVVPGSPAKIGSQAFGFLGGKVNPDFLAVGDSGSSVQTYANKNKIAFCDTKEYDPAERAKRNTPGDVDGNGLVSVADAVKLQKYLLGAEPNPDSVRANNADLNKDQKLNAVDLTLLKMKLLK